MNDAELRALCHRFFDAIEQQDVTTVAQCYAPGLAFWINITGKTSTRDDNLAVLRAGYARNRRRTYDDRIVHTFEGGFLVQYSVSVVAHDGSKNSLWACIVALCSDGQITRIDEYLDSGKFRVPLTAQPPAEAAGRDTKDGGAR
jgi:ketosteroid isomerase-like protein